MDKIAPRHIGMKKKIGSPVFLMYRIIETRKTIKKIPFHRHRKLMDIK